MFHHVETTQRAWSMAPAANGGLHRREKMLNIEVGKIGKERCGSTIADLSVCSQWGMDPATKCSVNFMGAHTHRWG